MKIDPGNDESLRKVLREWQTNASLPPRFQEGVWQRIERVESPAVPSAWAVISHWVGAMLPRPALAASYIVVLLAVGLTAGWTQGRQDSTRVKNELGQRYVRVLDPYLAPRQ